MAVVEVVFLDPLARSFWRRVLRQHLSTTFGASLGSFHIRWHVVRKVKRPGTDLSCRSFSGFLTSAVVGSVSVFTVLFPIITSRTFSIDDVLKLGE